MTNKKKWNPGVYAGDDPINDDTQIAYPIDYKLFNFNKNPQDNNTASVAEQDDVNGISGITPEILTVLTSPVGIISGAGIDVLLECSNIAGVVRYEIRVTPA